MTLDERLRGLIAGSVATKRLLHDAADEITRLTAENERLREALAFYADETNHVGEFVPAGEHDGVFRLAHHVSLVRADKGKRARAALEQP